MKPKASFDPNLDGNSRRRHWSIRLIGPLAIIAAFFGLAMAAMAEHTARLQPVWCIDPTISQYPMLVQQPGPVPEARALVVQPRDPFVMMAPAGIDPEMVAPAPVGIDEATVVHPGNGVPRQVPTPGLAPVVPYPGLTPSPDPGRQSPQQKAPRSLRQARPR
jgi:hypothetical protein